MTATVTLRRGAEGGRGRDVRLQVLGYAALGALAYLPVLRTAPGRVAADTKQYLYLDPGRLMSRAWSMWDPNVGFGTVTHQNIGYLFPMGPFYWAWERMGVPDWVAQRLWLGTILLAAALGMLFLFRTIGVRGPGAVVGALVYMLSPYSLHYAARISVLLLPWAGLGWMLGLVIRALRQDSWRHPAIFALLVQVVGSVNATALLFAGLAPALWVPYATFGLREVQWRRALRVCGRIALLCIPASLWWIAGLWAQGSYGLNILRFTETLYAVSRTPIPSEVLRGLGYWFFYGRDKLGPWIEAGVNYTQWVWLIVVSYALPVLALAAAAVVRWRLRAYFVLLTVVGTVIAVGAHPYSSPTPLGAGFKRLSETSTAAFAMRSTGRATPLVVMGLAVLLGVGVNAAWAALVRADRLRLAWVAVVGVVVLAVLNLPALWNGTFYGRNLQRPEHVPGYWRAAIAAAERTGTDRRLLELPGSDFASYEWGNTVDPITPGLTDKPYAARELIPYGTPASANLLNAVDAAVQQRQLDPRALAPLARLMRVDVILLRNDLQWERYRLVRPKFLWQLFVPTPPGLVGPETFGPPAREQGTRFPFLDAQELGEGTDLPQPPSLALFRVEGTPGMLTTHPRRGGALVAGDGDGLVAAAAVGVVDGRGLVRYSAASGRDDRDRAAAAADAAVLVVTDTNRQRGRRWSTVYDNTGITEGPGARMLGRDLSDARLDVFPDAPASAYSRTVGVGVAGVDVSGYGNPISFTPENRGIRALDGDPLTAWLVGSFSEVHGERIRVRLRRPVTTDRLTLMQPIRGDRDRWITRATLTFDGRDRVPVRLDQRSRERPGQTVRFGRRTFRTLEIRVDDTNRGRLINYAGTSAVGFAEIRIVPDGARRPIRGDEVVEMPTDLLRAAGAVERDRPLVYLMARERTIPVPPRYDPELRLARRFEVPSPRTFTMAGEARLHPNAPDAVIDRVLGYEGPVRATSSAHLAGSARARASAALDGDPTTAWVSRYRGLRRQWIRVRVPEPITVDRLDLQIVADGRHSVPTQLELFDETGASRVIDLPPITDVPRPGATVRVPVRFAPLQGRMFRLRINHARVIPTFDFYCECDQALPVGIAEIGMPGVPVVRIPDRLPERCRTDLLRLDGRPLPVRVTGTTEQALARAPLALRPCDPDGVRLGPGRHLLWSARGSKQGFDVDRLTLASAAGGGPWPGLGPTGTFAAAPGGDADRGPGLRVIAEGRVRIRAEVTGRGAGWVVLGQSVNPGWRARLDGRDLGPARLVDGFANGWEIPATATAGSRSLVIEWVPQRRVNAALGISAVAALVAAGIAVAPPRRRRRRDRPAVGAEQAGSTGAGAGPADPPVTIEVPASVYGPLPIRPAVLTTLAAAVGGVAVAGPRVGIWAAPAAWLLTRHPASRRVLAWVPPFLLAGCGAYIAAKQWYYAIIPTFEWPTFFWQTRTFAWLAVVVFATDGLVTLVRDARRVPPVPADAGGDP